VALTAPGSVPPASRFSEFVSVIEPFPPPCHHALVTAKELQARDIVQTLRDHGFPAYLAGGCVRDKLLGVEPKDFDVATSARVTDVQKLFAHTIPVGAQFGVVLVVYGGNPFEVATFRSDGVYLDGRHPVNVRFSDAREDALRRDFTINGMFYDPVSEQVIDYVGGQQDLAAGIIRAVGDPHARFAEDRLRMLRAIRLAARLGFTIAPETFAAIRDLAQSIVEIAWERIGDEVIKILSEGRAKRAFTLLSESGLLPAILPEIEALHGVEQSPDFHPEGDVFVHTLLLLDKLDHPSETLALGALLHDVAKPLCRAQRGERITFYGHCEKGAELAVAICQRLKRSRATWERVAYLVKNHLRLLNAPEMRPATLKRFLREDGIAELLELARIDALSSSGDLRPYEFCRGKLSELSPEQITPPRLLSGHDLIALGLPPGPRFKEILDAVEEAQLEGRLLTREDALAWVQQYRHNAQ
jgi:poly(A) polymerase